MIVDLSIVAMIVEKRTHAAQHTTAGSYTNSTWRASEQKIYRKFETRFHQKHKILADIGWSFVTS